MANALESLVPLTLGSKFLTTIAQTKIYIYTFKEDT